MSTRMRINDWTTEDGLLKLKGLARDLVTDKAISRAMGISRDTFYRWIKKEPILQEVINEGRAPADVIIEDALIREALGYWVTEWKKTTFDDGTYILVEKERWIKPHFGAIKFLLQNMKPEKYSEMKKSQREVIPLTPEEEEALKAERERVKEEYLEYFAQYLENLRERGADEEKIERERKTFERLKSNWVD